MTPLTKQVTRRTGTTVRDGSRRRLLVVTIYPSGFFGLRLSKCRQEETIDFESVYSMAVKARVNQERAAKLAARKLRRKA